jgi:hypothetical protein
MRDGSSLLLELLPGERVGWKVALAFERPGTYGREQQKGVIALIVNDSNERRRREEGEMAKKIRKMR